MDFYERKAFWLVVSVAAAVLAALVYVGIRWGFTGLFHLGAAAFIAFGLIGLCGALYASALMLASAIGGYLRNRD